MTVTFDENYVPKKPTGRGVPKPGESLADLDPDLAGQWHPSRNGDVNPSDVRLGSQVRAWWRCPCGYEWSSVVANRSRSKGCPACAGTVVTKTNCLATVDPEISAQWHPDKNGALTPHDVTRNSNKKVWWRCSAGHEFQSMVCNRRIGRSGCGRCSDRIASPTNNLALQRPEVAAQWHPTMNGDLTPDKVTYGSGKKVWWLCDRGHEWLAPVTFLTMGYGCSYCHGKKVAPEDSIARVFPAIAAEWHPTKNGSLTPRLVKPKSGRLIWWLCEQGHEWQSIVSVRTVGTSCHECSVAQGSAVWTRPRLRQFVENLLPHVASGAFSQAELFALCQQAGVTRSSDVTKTVVGGTAADLESLIERLGNDTVGDVVYDSDEADQTELDGESLGLTVEEETSEQADTDIDLPGPRVGSVLAASSVLLASADEEAAEFLVASQVAKLWTAAYEDPEAVNAATSEPADDVYRETVRAAFRDQYEQALAVTPPVGWSFRPDGPGTSIAEPSLMQRHVANQVVRRRRYGNWSGTGAGKTVSAVLAARLLEAGTVDGIVLVVCPNNTVAGWERVIQDCYVDNRVATKTLDPTWAPGDGPRWLVINVEALQQARAADQVVELLGRADINIDMVVLDEVHFFKHRGVGSKAAKGESTRRENLRNLLAEAASQNTDLAVLGMSATPVINDLHEGRSILELVGGVEYDELATRATIQNSVRMHQRFVLDGTRYLPKYEAELDEHHTDIDCDHLVDDIRALGRKAHPADVEKILLAAKLPTIIDECMAAQADGKRVLIYSEYVEGIFGPLADELEAAGLKVGSFNGTDKTGLVAFTGVDETGRPVPDAGRVDVLIGSSAIGTGVDGLQHVTDTLIFATLPWTSAGYQQVVGRVHRQGQQSHKVRVVTPVTVADTELIDGPEGPMPWSWCRRRSAVIHYKRTIADAVLDGTVPKASTLTPAKITQSIVKWLHRLDTEDEITAERQQAADEAA